MLSVSHRGESDMTVEAALCGAVERRYVPLWLTTVFAPDVSAAFDELGVDQSARYFATRVAPLGPVDAPVVVATFYNFSPAAIAGVVPEVWQRFSPRQLLDAQLTGVQQKLDRALASIDGGVVSEATALLRRAAEAACDRPEGRPLFAGYASLPWPDDPRLQLWHAHYLLREFRGDGHIAVLAADGLSGIEALQLHIAYSPAVGPVFRATRRWTDEQWETSLDGLRGRGWLTSDAELTLTPSGQAYRQEIEDRTDACNVPSYAAVGNDGCERLLDLGATIGAALVADGGSAFAALIPAD
jgi:hypothetical protein